jgi:hypothetical protein
MEDDLVKFGQVSLDDVISGKTHRVAEKACQPGRTPEGQVDDHE